MTKIPTIMRAGEPFEYKDEGISSHPFIRGDSYKRDIPKLRIPEASGTRNIRTKKR